MNAKRFFRVVVLVMVGALLVAACAPSPPEAPAVQAGQAEHQEEDGHTHSPDDHMAGAHGVPEDAAAVSNPIEAK